MKRRSETRSLPLGLEAEWRRNLGHPDCPYVYRWMFGHKRVGSIRLHHWLGRDDDRAPHDHPWSFVTVVLRGGYIDCARVGPALVGDRLRRGSVRYRPALHQHTVVPDTGGCWTLVLTGPVRRNWGFWPEIRGRQKFIKANKWFLSYGHHPCDS